MNIADLIIVNGDDWIVVLWILGAFVGVLIGATKNRKAEGLLLALLFSVLGLIILLFIPPKEEGAPTFSAFGGLVILLSLAGLVAFIFRDEIGRGAKRPAPPAPTEEREPVAAVAPTTVPRDLAAEAARRRAAENAEIARRYGAQK